jgi:hypothetical protein
MINFNVYYEEFIYPVSVERTNTVFELKATVVGVTGLEYEGISIFLEGIGSIDDENLSELSLENLDLIHKKYKIFVYNMKDPSTLWKNCCTRQITEFNLLTQVGCFIDNSYPVCHVCRVFCSKRKEISYEILEKGFFCMCSNNTQCCFAECASFARDKDIVFKNINSILNYHADALVKKEMERINKLKQEILKRHFDFEES